jgi:hypothetical protein
MLSYTNQPLCTYRDIPCIYPLRMAWPGGQLSFSISTFLEQTSLYTVYLYSTNTDKCGYTRFWRNTTGKLTTWPSHSYVVCTRYIPVYKVVHSCMIAQCIRMSKAIQASMNGIPTELMKILKAETGFACTYYETG